MSMTKKIILHFDMNSYFASVEQQANPWLRGKPVGVVATMTSNGCIIASSREAKAVGIKTGCRVPEARQLYPGIILIEVDPSKYRSTSQRIFSICAEYTEAIETYSIDEAFLDLSGLVSSYEQAVQVARTIQRRIRDEVGEWLRCSMGVAPTRWLAKFASDTAPKGGVVVLTQNNLYSYLQGRDVEQAWGIAGATAARLSELGVTTLDQLARYPVSNIMSSLGIRGYHLWANVNGIELGGLEAKRPPKSIGHSHVLRRRTRDIRFYQSVIMRLCERTGRRLREQGLQAGGIYYQTRLEHRGSVGGSKKVHHPIISTTQIYRHVWEALGDELSRDIPNFFAVGLFRLQPQVNQLTLFNKRASMSTELSQALDEINSRYGEETIVRGPLLRLGQVHAPDRVGFRQSVEAEFNGIRELQYGKD
ncbi:DNA polymerase IV [Patescibacteria group bacterium]|nr:DNA polymerase IV [Patescibacteria group bacterium]